MYEPTQFIIVDRPLLAVTTIRSSVKSSHPPAASMRWQAYNCTGINTDVAWRKPRRHNTAQKYADGTAKRNMKFIYVTFSEFLPYRKHTATLLQIVNAAHW